MILTETIEIEIVKGNLNHYRRFDSGLEIGDLYTTNVSDLSKGSHIKIECGCDICDSVKIMEYRTYYKLTGGLNNDYYCNKCKSIKSKETSMERYGVDSPSKSDIVKKKVKDTIKERYGVDNIFENDIIKKKIKNTLMERYGVSNPLELSSNQHDKNYHGMRKTVREKYSQVFLEKANDIHGDNYNYLSNYIKMSEKITIECKTCGYVFKQRPKDHIHSKQGCPQCKISKGEREIANILECNNIKYIPQKTFGECMYKKGLYFDFYLSEYDTCIEYDGEQHYKAVEYFGGEDKFKIIQERDNIKNKYCLDNNLTLYRIRYDENIDIKLKQIIENI